jgi:hypothetical protein
MDPETVTWSELVRASIAELESLYASSREVIVPKGRFAGRHLVWLDTPAARHPVLRTVEHLFFAELSWRIDFDRRRWFWLQDRVGIGRFSASVGPSRWRATDTIRLLYDDPLLPGFVNQWLYDEVKPLSDDLCLGLGGISAKKSVGEQFFFALGRV